MFEIRSKNTYEEYMRAMRSIAAARSVFYKSPARPRTGLYILLAVCIVLEIISIWKVAVYGSEWFSAFAVFLGMLICMYLFMLLNAKNRAKNAYMTKQIEKEMFDIWNSDKQMRDCDETIRFDEDGIEVTRSFGSVRINYDCVYRLVETNTNLYILLSMNRFCNIRKESCTVEQYDFILAHCSSEQTPPIKV